LRYWLCPHLLSAHPIMEAGFKASTYGIVVVIVL
jgi:hypothetical protein